MRNGIDNNSCLYGEELVSYIYDELAPAGRAAFENHLLECSGCTAEFAEVSMSRLGVFEWHRDEFAPLATPHFAIPYDAPQPRVSWLEAIRGLVASPMRLGFAGAPLAALVCGFVLITNNVTSEQTVAGITESVPTAPATPPVPVRESEPVVVEPASKETAPPTVREYRSAQLVRQTRVVQAKVTVPKKRITTETTNAAASAPRLGSFVETEDKSLRLADLVADIDTRD